MGVYKNMVLSCDQPDMEWPTYVHMAVSTQKLVLYVIVGIINVDII